MVGFLFCLAEMLQRYLIFLIRADILKKILKASLRLTKLRQIFSWSRNQSNDLQRLSVNWFLYNDKIGPQCIKESCSIISEIISSFSDLLTWRTLKVQKITFFIKNFFADLVAFIENFVFCALKVLKWTIVKCTVRANNKKTTLMLRSCSGQNIMELYKF